MAVTQRMHMIASVFSCEVRRSLIVRSAGVITHPVRVGAICGIAARERPVVLQSSWHRAKGSGLLSSAPFSTVMRRCRSSCFFPFLVVAEIVVGPGTLVPWRSAPEFLRVLAMSA